MRRIPTVALLLGAACAIGAVRAQSYHACLEYNSNYYDLTSDASITTLDRYQGANLVDRQHYSPFHLPAAGTTAWDEGVAFAATMQTRNAWLNAEQTSAATWVHSDASDVWTFYTTVNGVPNQFEFASSKCRSAATTTAAPTPAPTTGAPNCLAWGSSSGATCTANEDCCGAGTMFPQCIPKNSGKQCCTHFKGAATCNASQTCCGAYGPGASSSAFCCSEGSTCCHASSSTQGSSCCPTGTTCCAGASIGLCCASDEVCVPNMNQCSKAASTTSTAPTAAPTQAAGVHRGCISYNGWFYDLKSDATITTLDRYQGTTFVDRQQYSPFHMPAEDTSAWDEGVAFAATMQTRNAWLNSEQTSAATWVVNGGVDTFTWSTTVNGAPVQFSFTTSACL
jgi:hypothetical protein